MTSTGQPDDRSPLQRFEDWAQQGFDWITEHPREVLFTLGGAALFGLVVTGIFEWHDYREASAQEALGTVERNFAQSLGGDPRLVRIPEPANAEQARRSREEALAAFEGVVSDHPGSRAADFARLRAAEVEIDLGQLDAGAERVAGLAADLDADDPLRAVAFRLLGFVRESRGQTLEAGLAYEEGAQVEAYPDRGGLWLLAALSFEQAGELDRAVQAYQAVLGADPGFAEQAGVLDRLSAVESRVLAAAPTTTVPVRAPTAPEAPSGGEIPVVVDEAPVLEPPGGDPEGN